MRAADAFARVRGPARRRARAGFTLIEIAFVLGIVGTLAALATTSYRGYIERVRVQRAIMEITAIGDSLEIFQMEHAGLPPTLAAIDLGGLRDPWDNAYEYLPFAPPPPAAGSWAAGPAGPGGGGGGGAGAGGGGAGAGGGGGSAGASSASAGSGGGGSSGGSSGPSSGSGTSGGGGGGGGGGSNVAGARKDRFLVPINSDFDLYSKGADGRSVPALTASQSRDDVVRAADGAFVGLASQF